MNQIDLKQKIGSKQLMNYDERTTTIIKLDLKLQY